MRFVAIDVETANRNFSSICQIGLVRFEGGVEIAAESLHINPEDYFDPFNTRIHGITAETVAAAKCLPDIHGWLHEWTSGEILVSHTPFDRGALAQAFLRYTLPELNCRWADSAAIARNLWGSPYNLKSLTERFGIVFQHHDALHDARAAGLVVLRAMAEAGSDILETYHAARATRHYRKAASVRRDGDGDGALTGETIVFTGELTIPRDQAADMAAKAGADVRASVTGKTTMLVVGQRDLMPGWDKKSGKQKRAEELIEKGQDISVVGEADFVALASITE